MPAAPLLARLRRLLGASGQGSRGESGVRPTAVYVAELDGLQVDPARVRRVSPDGEFSQPAIAPSGRALLYWGATAPGALHGVWLTWLDGATLRLSMPEVLEGHPAWCPDERRLVCFSTAGHAPAEPWTPARQFAVDRSPRNLWIVVLADGRRARITDGAYVDERPCVAPDGQAVCFVSNRSGRLNLWMADIDGSGLRQLTDGALDYRPTIAPDASRLAWFTREERGGSHQLAMASWPHAKPLPVELDRAFRWVHGPQWLDDSRRLLVHGLAEGDRKASLWVLDTVSGRSDRLVVPGFDSCSHGSLDQRIERLAFDSREPPPGIR